MSEETTKKSIQCKNAPEAIGPYSQAIATDNLVFVSGQLPIDPTTKSMGVDVKELATQSLSNIKAILEEAGSSMEKVVKVTIFLTDMADFARVNEAYAAFFKAPFPARSTIAVAALPLDAKIEIEVIALK